ncbi:MAG: radical SAM protein [Phycisphaerae bacterium]
MSLPVLAPPARPRLPAAVRSLASMASNSARWKLFGHGALLKPLFVSWEINSACNLRCPYCYIHDRSYGFSDRGLAFDKIKIVLGRIAKVCPDIMLLGGEPFLHPEWDRIVDYCCDHLGLRVRCITNGTLLEKHLAATGRLSLLVVSDDQTRQKLYPKQMTDMKRQLERVAATYPNLTILVNFVLCADDDPAWLIERFHALTEQGLNLFVNVDRYFGRQIKRRTGRVHMTDATLDWLSDTRRPVPFCNPTLLPLLDPQANLIYPCCYYNEQTAGSLADTDYHDLMTRSAERFGQYPFDKCDACTTTAYLDASVATRRPIEAVRHYHSLYNR